MNWWLLILPIVGTMLGWWFVWLALKLLFHPVRPTYIAGFKLQGLLPGKHIAIVQALGRLAATFFSPTDMEEKITHPDNVKKIMPQAEEHIDTFLRVKLVKSMPVVGMLVGDKTINNLKALFMTELEELFPKIMKSYIANLQEDVNIEHIITTKMLAVSPARIEQMFLESTRRERRMACLAGAAGGLIIGIIQFFLLQLIVK